MKEMIFIDVEKATMTSEQIHREANKAASSIHNDLTISEAQKDAGTYKKGHIEIQGIKIAIENPKDSYREGVSKSGKAWKTKLNNHYGYIKSTQGKDKDHVDCFIGDNPKSDKVFIINQMSSDNKFDEHKCMIGFDSEDTAKKAYLSNYEKGWNGVGSIKEMTMSEFKTWVYDGKKTQVAKGLMYFIDLEKAHQGLVPKKQTVTRHGKSFTQTFWVAPEGQNHDDEIRAKAKERGLYVPPAWTSLQLNQDEKGACQVKGVDTKGRGVYIYSKEFSEANASAKFARLKAFTQQMPKLVKNLEANLSTSEEAKALYLITKTGFRAGGDTDTKADVQAYGATTLLSDHVKVSGDTVSFNFTGKKGVGQEHTVTDSNIANIMRGKSGKIFDTNDSKILAYLKDVVGKQFKVKDIRTYVATDTAIKHAKTLAKPTNIKEFKAFQKEICTVVSKKLGNTPAMAKGSYIDPGIWDEFKKGWM